VRETSGQENDLELTAVEMVALAGLVASGFVATNVDNLLILVILLGANGKRRSAVLLGFIASAIAVICVSALGVALGSLVGASLIGYLGLVPLSLGSYMLYTAWRGGTQGAEQVDVVANRGEPGIWFSTFVLMFSNSGDSIAVFLPLLAESGRTSLLLIICTYLMMALLWACLSYLISGQPSLAKRIEKRAEKIVPWVMIGVGAYILFDTATDTLV
jgi:cadmium resistance protein CadD (predicted permease)